MRRSHALLALSAVLGASSACARAPDASEPRISSETKGPTPDFSTASCARGPGERPLTERLARQGSTVALAQTEQMLLAYVADRDSQRVQVVDVDKG